VLLLLPIEHVGQGLAQKENHYPTGPELEKNLIGRNRRPAVIEEKYGLQAGDQRRKRTQCHDRQGLHQPSPRRGGYVRKQPLWQEEGLQVGDEGQLPRLLDPHRLQPLFIRLQHPEGHQALIREHIFPITILGNQIAEAVDVIIQRPNANLQFFLQILEASPAILLDSVDYSLPKGVAKGRVYRGSPAFALFNRQLRAPQ